MAQRSSPSATRSRAALEARANGWDLDLPAGVFVVGNSLRLRSFTPAVQ